MDNIIFLGLEYEDEDFLKSAVSLRCKEFLLTNDFIFDFNSIYRNINLSRMFGIKSLAEIASIYINENKINSINKLFFRELISEQIGFANCFLNNNEFKTIAIDSIVENKKDTKILDVLESKRKYNKFLKEKLWIVQKG